LNNEYEEKMKFFLLLFFSLLVFTIAGCENDPEIVTVPDDGTQITVNLQNLPAIGDTVKYIVWLEGIGYSEKIGVLDNITSQSASKTFTPLLGNLRRANTVFVTIQSANDTVPGNVRILAGSIQANSGSLDVTNASSIGAALDSTLGNYTLFTPTDTINTQQKSGIWFVNYNGGNLQQGLINLPELAAAWRYEGRVEINGAVLSTGRFIQADEADLQSPYSGTHAQIDFPGEDFLNNPPAGVIFPLDLAGARVSIVAVPNNNVSSQGFTIMSADIPADAAPFTTYGMNLNSVFPVGNFTIDVNF
jgi:predicted small lipoprotein YifL